MKSSDKKSLAEIQRRFFELEKAVIQLKNRNGAYYCESQEDFDLIVDMRAYENPNYIGKSNSYEPYYCYDKSDFKGPGWYIFECKYNDDSPNEYWVEKLADEI